MLEVGKKSEGLRVKRRAEPEGERYRLGINFLARKTLQCPGNREYAQGNEEGKDNHWIPRVKQGIQTHIQGKTRVIKNGTLLVSSYKL